VTIPAVIVSAADDPFVDAGVYREATLPGQLLLHLEPVGGHIGYVARNGLGWRHWLDGALVHYAAELVRLARPAGGRARG